MTTSSPPPEDETTTKNNPRSQSQSDALVYRKTSDTVNFAAEAAELSRCAERNLTMPHVKPVELVAYDSDTNTLTTRRVEGKELFHSLWNPTGFLGRVRGHRLPDLDVLFERVEELGHWLSEYHLSSRLPSIDSKADQWLVNSFNTRLDEMSRDQLLTRRRIERIRHHCMGPLTSHQDHDPGFYCQIHGDFIVYNMLLEKELDLRILDFGDTRVGHSLEDVVRFYSQLWAMAQTSRRRKPLFTSMAESFLKAYGYPPSITKTARWNSLMAYNFIVHLDGQQAMKDLLSWNSRRELNQITQAGLRWINYTWP